MDEATLTRRLRELAPPDPEGARERALAAARAAPSRSTARSPRPRTRLATLAFAAIAAAGFLTPPGQAVATWVAERIGIGEPGGEPTLRQLRQGWNRGTIADGVPAHVLARGPAPYGHYEFITFRSNRDGAHCFEFNLPEMRNSGGGGCEPLPARRGLALDVSLGVAGHPDLPPGESVQSVGGRVSADIATVEVRLDGRLAATRLTEIPAGLATRLGFERPFGFFVAFPEGAAGGGLIEVTARGANGAELAREVLSLPDFGLRG